MTTYTLTHDVHGTKVRYQLNKTANDTKFMTIENGPQGLQGPQGPCISLCFSFTRVIESRVAHTRATHIKPYLFTNYEQMTFFYT